MLNENEIPTKRQVLKTLIKIYDPKGLIAHYIIRGKIIQQEVWKEGVEWDEKIPENLRSDWQQLATVHPSTSLHREAQNSSLVRDIKSR